MLERNPTAGENEPPFLLNYGLTKHFPNGFVVSAAQVSYTIFFRLVSESKVENNKDRS